MLSEFTIQKLIQASITTEPVMYERCCERLSNIADYLDTTLTNVESWEKEEHRIRNELEIVLNELFDKDPNKDDTVKVILDDITLKGGVK